MAMSTLLRSSCRLAAFPKFPALQNVARLSSSSLLTTTTPNQKSAGLQVNQFAALTLSKPNTHTLVRQISTSPVSYSSHGNHSTLWNIERGLSLGLLAALPIAFLVPSQAMDSLLAVSMVMHQHWGLEAIVIDYVRPIIFGNVIPKIALGLLYLLSAACLGGLFYFIYHDIGIVNSVKKIWAIGSDKQKQ